MNSFHQKGEHTFLSQLISVAAKAARVYSHVSDPDLQKVKGGPKVKTIERVIDDSDGMEPVFDFKKYCREFKDLQYAARGVGGP